MIWKKQDGGFNYGLSCNEITDYNEIFTRFDWYNYKNAHWGLFYGSIHQQNFHHHYHTTNAGSKWGYYKDPTAAMHYFYKALHRDPPASEKLCDWEYPGIAGTNQIWALYNIKNYYWR